VFFGKSANDIQFAAGRYSNCILNGRLGWVNLFRLLNKLAVGQTVLVLGEVNENRLVNRSTLKVIYCDVLEEALCCIDRRVNPVAHPKD